MNIYQINTPPLAEIEGEKLGAFLKEYDIHVNRIGVWSRWPNGHMEKNSAMAETIRGVSTAGGAGVVAGTVAAGSAMAAPIAAFIAAFPWALPILIAVDILGGVGNHMANKRSPLHKRVDGEYACCSIIKLEFADVTSRRQRWAEYLLALYCLNKRWAAQLPPNAISSAKRAILKHGEGYMPTPWGGRK